jgi:twitching motility protein PilT
VPLVDSLLAAIVREDGESLVLHVGERPIVVSPRGPLEAATATLTLQAMDSLLSELLRPDSLQALAEYGAVEAELPPSSVAPGEQFTVVAARGGDDIWIELRRRRTAPPQLSPGEPPLAAPAQTVATLMARPEPPPPMSEPAVVLPMSRNPVRPDFPARTGLARPGGLDRLLRLAAARGAEALYLVSHSKPSIRVDGEIAALDSEPSLGPQEVESLILEVRPERSADAPATEGEWICDVPDVGRVRCQAFQDHRGPGGIFRIIPARALSAEQLGLSREVQNLCAEPEGLVLVTGPRASGKSTLLSAFVDIVNRTRSAHVITLESQVKVVHESRSALVSQREVRGTGEDLLASLRGVLREAPDVIMIEDLRTSAVIAEAIAAAAAGHLVIAGVAAHSASEAVVRILEQAPAERRAELQTMVAESLRGVVAQVLLRKSGGGRVAARELLLGTPSVATIIAEGRLAQLALAMESGRRHGMVPLTDALVGFVRSGAVDVKEAWRRASDRPALLKQLKREGIDTSFVERRA